MSAQIERIQQILGVPEDNIWGPRSQAALIGADDDKKKLIQRIVGVTADGQWGPISQTALNALTADNWFHCNASSFADPADVLAFKKAKAEGLTDIQAFKRGDNGIGQFGKVTAQELIPMVAVHATAMKARWGSVNAAAHRPVQVNVAGNTIAATVEDRISAPGRIDLNPACARLLELKPPFVVPASWRWA